MTRRMEFYLNSITKKNKLSFRNGFTRELECLSQSFSILKVMATLCSFLNVVPPTYLEEIIACIRLASFVKMYCDCYSSWKHVLFKLDDFTSFVRVICFKNLFNRLIKPLRMICVNHFCKTDFIRIALFLTIRFIIL